MEDVDDQCYTTSSISGLEATVESSEKLEGRNLYENMAVHLEAPTCETN